VTQGRIRSNRLGLAALVICAIWPITLGILWLVTGRTVPTINVRWVPGVPDEQRSQAERDLSLIWLEPKEPRTVTYFLMDAGEQKLEQIVRHPLIEDTAFIDRATFVLTNAPAARTWMGDRFTTPWPSALLYVSLVGCLISGVVLVLRD
jgi:hypothetical protein